MRILAFLALWLGGGVVVVRFFSVESGILQFAIFAATGFTAQILTKTFVMIGPTAPRVFAVEDAFNARITLPTLTPELQSEVEDRAADFMDKWGVPPGSLKMKEADLVVLYCAVAYAMAERGIQPTLDGESWNLVKRPLPALRWSQQKTQEKIEHMREVYQQEHGVSVELLPPR